MKICLISDSHGDIELVNEIARNNYDCDRFFDCGDSESVEEKNSPFVSVKGNCDYFTNLDKEKIISIFNKNILISHYKQSVEYLKNKNISIHFYGHTHIQEVHEESGIIFINPGSCSRPRDGLVNPYITIIINNENMLIKLHGSKKSYIQKYLFV